MSVSVLPQPSFHSRHAAPYHIARRSSTMERRKSILGSLKGKFGRKSPQPPSSSSSFRAEGLSRERDMNSHPERPAAPPTRRPDRPGMNAFTTPSTEPPPSYAAATTASPTAPAAAGDDDRYAFLSSFDTLIVVDDSGSMAGSRWNETARALESITPICTSHDLDGVDICFLNHPDNPYYHNITSAATVKEIFSQVRPGGSTPTGQRLWQILKSYLSKYKANPSGTKPLNIIVITDGEPSDDVESPIITTAETLDEEKAPAWQVGIQFFQVGRDVEAQKHLNQLDNELVKIARGPLRDIVDTVPFKGEQGGELNADGILKVVLGSVNRRLDRKESHNLHG